MDILLISFGSFLFGMLLAWLLWGYDDKPERKPAGAIPDTNTAANSAPAVSVPEKKPRDPNQKDDLKIIEGINHAMEEVLYHHRITNWESLAKTSVENLEAIVKTAKAHAKNVQDWPAQAALAADGRWKELMNLQSRLRKSQ